VYESNLLATEARLDVMHKIFIDEGEIPNKPIELMNGISQVLESYDLWNTCNTSERGEDLFFIPTIEDSSAFNWYLLDIEQDITILQERHKFSFQRR